MLRFADGGGRSYGAVGTSNVNLLALWTATVAPWGPWAVSAGSGRTTGSALITPHYPGQALSKTLTPQATWGVALAWKPSNTAMSSTGALLIFQDVATAQVDLRVNTNLGLQFTRNGTNIGPASPDNIIRLGIWNHVEAKVTIDPTAGSVECRLNGVVAVAPTTGINTRNTANSSANTIVIATNYGVPNIPNVYFDDIIIYDDQATDAAGNPDIHDFIGDCGVTVLPPSGAGTTTQWTPDSAAANYSRLIEAVPDATSYVESGTIGNRDTYALADLPAGISAVKSIATLHYATKTDVGSRQMGAVVRTGGANFTHPTGIDLGNGYLYYFRNWGSNPAAGAAWTVADINALEAGQVVNT